MRHILIPPAICLALTMIYQTGAQAPDDASEWTLYVANDNCPDYTWGYTEEQTRQALADIVRGHLDEMKRTDNEPPENRDRYNMAVTQEALCFVERYPDRKDELIRRIKEGRVFVSPYLCNTLWAFQSVEGSIRAFYPARRLERDWGIPMDVAEHIEEPSLPWGVATILAGCGIKWLSNPFYSYDSTFGSLKNPPLFIYEGPDGSRIRVVMDPWASNKSSYTQGAHVIRDPNVARNEWLPHYRQLGKSYPSRAILASGTHGDISPGSGGQARGFADAIIAYNKRSEPHPKIVNATLAQFCRAVDEAQAKTPFLQPIRGCFGHSWDVWPVSLAKYVADMREGERSFLAAESLLALAARTQPKLHEATRTDRERAEWCWAMLGDHAWNGTNDANKRHNADLRRRWSEGLSRSSQNLLQKAWNGLGITPSERAIVVFNNLSSPRADLVRIAQLPPEMNWVTTELEALDSQIAEEDGRRVLYCVPPEVAGFGLIRLQLVGRPATKVKPDDVQATSSGLESPFYRLTVDPQTGGIVSLIHKATKTDLVVGRNGRTLCQTIYHDGQEHTLGNVQSEVVAHGPVLARLRIRGTAEGIQVTNFVTVYADLDRVDFDLRISKPVTAKQERLCQVFPVMGKGAVLRIETPGAVIHPRPQPEGDLLPGADTRRFAIQGFVDASSPEGPGGTIAPLDAFVLRNDLDPITFEALGNDQNYREVVQNQNGVTEFRFRYSLRGHGKGYNEAEAVAWSRGVASPLIATLGRIAEENIAGQTLAIDPKRALATCLKPADGDASLGTLVRLWEIGGQSGPLTIGVKGYRRAFQTDLLERDLGELRIEQDKMTLDLRAHGFAALRLLP